MTTLDPFSRIPRLSGEEFAGTVLETSAERAAREWRELRDEVQRLRTSAYDVATGLSDLGRDAERVFGRVDGYDDVPLRMSRIGEEG